MYPVVSIGTQDFEYIRKNHYFYVDKTDFIHEWWENGDTVTLITRPRRFGKTLTMSMLELFFSNQYAGRTELFEGLSVWEDEKYRQLQGSWPVIFISFAGIKGNTYEEIRESMIQTIIDLYAKYRYLLESDALNQQEKEYFDYVKPGMSDTVAAMALHRLAICMYRYYGKKVIILLDEYDTPLHEAYAYDFWDKLIPFISKLFNCTFKTNLYMERSVLTGITRVSNESVFSDMNNLEVVMTTSCKYESAFGFTEAEVCDALEVFGLSDQLGVVRYWYDGFCFGNRKDIYNPWSITKYLDSGKFGTYWANTSSNKLVGKLIQEGSPELKMDAEVLLAGNAIQRSLEEEIVFDQLDESESSVWSLLLATGYLRAEHPLASHENGKTENEKSESEKSGNEESESEKSENEYVLSLTNLEIKKEFRKIIQRWFANPSARYNDFIKALLLEDVDFMNRYMNQVALQTFSFFDTGKQPSGETDPERFYHGFVLGLIVDLADRYLIKSNRESGLGRYDVVLEPLRSDLKAYVLEFKVFNPAKEKNLDETVKNALSQIEKMKYDTELLARGISADRISHYGFAFEGKHVLIG
ncbi:MAG: ATP-binding protein [Lachnospiraceae bacterium]|nr:ATP-binding protein [Lachnospiraceae bacterium]